MDTVHRVLAILVQVILSHRTSCYRDHPIVLCHYNIVAWLHHCFAAAVAVVGVAGEFGEVVAVVADGVSVAVADGGAVAVAVAGAGLVAATAAAAAEFSVDDDNCCPCPLPFLNDWTVCGARAVDGV